MKLEITTKGVLYDKCENMEELYDNYYFPLLVEFKELQKQNTELKERIKTYENPEDLTLMFMYCDEKAKDKIKELKDNWNKLKEWLEEEILKMNPQKLNIGEFNLQNDDMNMGRYLTIQRVNELMQEIEGGMNE